MNKIKIIKIILLIAFESVEIIEKEIKKEKRKKTRIESMQIEQNNFYDSLWIANIKKAPFRGFFNGFAIVKVEYFQHLYLSYL